MIVICVDGEVIGERPDLSQARAYAAAYVAECVDDGLIKPGARVEVTCRAGRFRLGRWEIVAVDPVKGA